MRYSHTMNASSSAHTELQQQYDAFKALNLNLNMQRGQPSDADLDLSNGLLSAVGPDDTVTPSGLDVRNYGGGVAGLPGGA